MLRIAVAALLLIAVLTGAAFAQEATVDELPWVFGSPVIELQTWNPRDSTTDFVAEYGGRVGLFPLAVLAGHDSYIVEFESRHRGNVLSHFSQVVTDGKRTYAGAPRFGEPLTGTVSILTGPVRNWRGLVCITPPDMDVPEQVELPMRVLAEGERITSDQPPPALLAAARRFTIGGVELLVYCPEADELSVSVTRWFQPGFRLEYLPGELVPTLSSTDPGEREYLGSLTAKLN